MASLLHKIPLIHSLKGYEQSSLVNDLIAGIVVTVLLIPQSLAYALLAGVPAEVGLYASIFPLVLYALFGTSRTLSVGPVAVISLMTASALGKITANGTADYLEASITLAGLSGFFLLLMGIFRLGFIANFLSHSVISGFMTASGIIIALSQLKYILGTDSSGDTLIDIFYSLYENTVQTSGNINYNIFSLAIGLSALILLYLFKYKINHFLSLFIKKEKYLNLLIKVAPIFVILSSILVAYFFQLDKKDLSVVGTIPTGLPSFQLPTLNIEIAKALLFPAMFISLIGYVESVSVGKTLASKRRQKIEPNQELIGLGSANIASSLSGGFPVTGGFSRSVVNFDAGAATQLSSIFAAIGIALTALFLTPLLYYLPKATLAATIIIAVLTLIDFSIFKETWRYEKHDFFAVFATVIITLFLGVEVGVSFGIISSIFLHLYRSSKPHVAEVGLIEGTEHFRNVQRYHVSTDPKILTLRIDESLSFINASFLEDRIYEKVYQRDAIAHVILMCSAVNEIDHSALETLEMINQRLNEQGIKLHLSEVKGPVMDALKRSGFLAHLSGNIYLTQFLAYSELIKHNN